MGTAQRATNRPETNAKSAAHQAAKGKLHGAINRKNQILEELCNYVNNDPSGIGYKLVPYRLGPIYHLGYGF